MHFNPTMLVLARQARGMTQSQLSEKIEGLNQGNLSKYEKGIIEPTEEVIEKFASILQFPASFFKQTDSVVPLSKFYYRKRITIPRKELTEIESKMTIIKMGYENLLEEMEIPANNLPKIPVSKLASPSDIAFRIRQFFNMSSGPVKSDFTNILEKNGVTIFYLNVKCEKFDGMTVMTNSNAPIIFLNKNTPNDKKKFTLAHELGHLVMHIPFTSTIEFQERLQENDVVEKEANEFAGEFLMPSFDIKNDLVRLTYSKLSDLKIYWQVSKHSIVYRAGELNIIDKDKKTTLFIELSKHGEKPKESFDINLDEPKLIPLINQTFINTLGYQKEEVARVTNLFLEDYETLFEWYKPKLRVAV